MSDWDLLFGRQFPVRVFSTRRIIRSCMYTWVVWRMCVGGLQALGGRNDDGNLPTYLLG